MGSSGAVLLMSSMNRSNGREDDAIIIMIDGLGLVLQCRYWFISTNRSEKRPKDDLHDNAVGITRLTIFHGTIRSSTL